ncbi:MAG TPA: ASKHA domain-containing protein, partial [Spirochaetota bacterium]|nr:ASKHA domain-containing protein [Spirochaetota bacterium]
MPAVEFNPAGIKVDVPEGTELLDAATRAGVSIQAPCGGKGTCGKCAVRIVSGTPVVRQEGAKIAGLREGEVLACRAAVGADDLIVEVPEHRLAADDRPDEQEISPALSAVLTSSSRTSLSEIVTLTLPEPGMDDGISDLERVARELKKTVPGYTGDVDVMPDTMRKLPDALREQNMNITVSCCNEGGRVFVADVNSGTRRSHYGIAIDLGTTSISVRCVDLDSGKVLSTMSGYNGQVACGLDVISRIQYGKSRERLDDLRSRALETIHRLTGEITSSLGISHSDIHSAVVSGNTVMIHLLLGIKAEYLRIAPYTPAVMNVPPMRAKDAGLEIHPGAMVYFSPAVGSYVGGDITAGMLAAPIDSSDAVNMFIDIGTNGELVVGNSDFLLACACSAGPAFEGGGIGCGMRATRGAVNGVNVDRETGAADVRVIDDVKPEGICGSGIIDLMAELFLKGFL